MENKERLKHYYQGGDAVLEQLIEFCGMFYDRLPPKNKLQAWLMDARVNWRTVALENGIDLSMEAEE